jgi:hypothetical protein
MSELQDPTIGDEWYIRFGSKKVSMLTALQEIRDYRGVFQRQPSGRRGMVS